VTAGTFIDASAQLSSSEAPAAVATATIGGEMTRGAAIVGVVLSLDC
jgi:hypothetical protein